MKRLLFYLNQINGSDTSTYRYTVYEDGVPVQKEIYDGECGVIYVKPGGEALERAGKRRDPVFWRNGISYAFERTSRVSPDRPAVTAAIPAALIGITDFTAAAADFCLREIKPYFDRYNDEYANRSRPDAENGKFFLHSPGSEVLIRNSAYFKILPAKDYENKSGAVVIIQKFNEPPPDRMCLCVRMEIQLPRGKLKRAKKMLLKDLPGAVEQFARSFDKTRLRSALELEKTQNGIREFLREKNYCVFIANGSVLAREKDTQSPMENALPFISAPGCEIEIGGIRGMGFRRGVTVVTGGGYSGKSTVLNAIAAGIHNRIAGDGRELCITDESAVTITAEDGRAVSRLNISPFIKWIPGGDPRVFSTARASGSTSQAANIIEAVDCGSTLLLIDEDRSATNFMIRDALMKELIKKEPITPFTDRVRELASDGVSTILVIGGSGEYLSVADNVYLMDDFIIGDITPAVKDLAPSVPVQPPKADWAVRRVPESNGFTAYPSGSGSERLEISDTGFIVIGDERIDVRALHNINSEAQIAALAFMLVYLSRSAGENDDIFRLALIMRGLAPEKPGGPLDLNSMIRALYEKINADGLDVIVNTFFTSVGRFLDLPRGIELRAAINRMRRIKWSDPE